MGRAWRSSSRASTRSPEAGLAISSTAITRPFRIWIPGSGCVCAAFCVSVRSGAVGAEGAIISAGPMLSLPRRGCSLLHKPRRRCVNPLGGEPPTGEPDAGEPPVRFGGREERIQSPLPTPIGKTCPATQLNAHEFMFFRFRHLVDLRDVNVREFLNVLKPGALGIFRNRFVLEHLLQFVILVPAYVADRSAMFLRDIVDLSRELLTSFFG